MSTFEETSVNEITSDETPIGTPIETPLETPNDELSNPIEDESNPLRQLISACSTQKAPFCCGGSIPIKQGSDIVSRFEKLTCDDGQVMSPGITLRWDVPGGNVVRKLTLPLVEGETGVDDLLKDCAPATFGKEGEEILDESYRKAAKLDSDQFSSSFSPYEIGIVDAIAQSLLPGVASTFADGKSILWDDLGLVAELYKLNVYSGPSGKFRAHVDTPRGTRQFASLVVCLPYSHEGGQLRVAHQGQERVFDWCQESTNAIQWAAFYSDCEHEVLEVKRGHRITLTYNLYAQERVGALLRQNTAIDTRHFDVYAHVADAIKSADFLPEGGKLDFFCQHAYAHTSNSHRGRLSHALKGVDAIYYSIFTRLGLNVEVKPVIYDEMVKDDRDDLVGRRGSKDLDPNADLIGTGFHDIQIRDWHDDMHWLSEQVHDIWESEWISDVRWCNNPVHEELAMAQAAYGNEPSVDWHYSAAAILVDVPTFDSEVRTKAMTTKC